jgi:hypothetical protein
VMEAAMASLSSRHVLIRTRIDLVHYGQSGAATAWTFERGC